MSAKTSAQPGRRTPLSLSGTVTKGQPNKSGNTAANGSGGNANGHTSANNNKPDNKLQQQQTVNNNASDPKENPNKKQQAEKKQHQQNDNKKSGSEKNPNGVNNKQQQPNDNKQNKEKQQQPNDNKQQQQNKEKQQQNGNEVKLNEKDKKEKLEKQEDKPEKQDKAEKDEIKTNEAKKDQEKAETKNEDKKVKEDKIDDDNKKDEKEEKEKQTEKSGSEIKSKDVTENKMADVKQEQNAEKMEVVPEEQQQQQKSPPVTPKTNNKGSKTSTPSNKTPTKALEKTPQKSPSKPIHVVIREVTTAIDVDVEMEPLAVEHSPIKSSQLGELPRMNISPSATSTPGKITLPKRNTAAPKSDVQLAMQTGLSPERPRPFSQISGRKSIRPITDYTPSKFQSNLQFRESYRRINTELDATNTSLNVTVGSEVPNNSSFSFFGRGRKRDRTPPQNFQSAIGELQTDVEISPPKRARYDMQGFFNVVSSPLTLLRNRFSKATLQSSTPVKLEEKLNSAEDEIEVQNVSGVSIHEEINKTDKESENTTTNSEDDATLGVEAAETQAKKNDGIENTPVDELELKEKEIKDVSLKSDQTCAMQYTSEQSDIKITETPLHPTVGDPMAKNKRCIVM